MKTALRIVGLLFLAFVAYAYFEMSSDSEKEPADVDKMMNDPEGYIAAHAPAALHPELAAQIPDSDDKSEQASPKAASPSTNPANDVPAKDTGSTASPDTNSAKPVADSVSNPIKPWTPPAVMPAKPNWTWTTSDGTTYQNVTITEIHPATVSIMHSLGPAHVSIATLPPDIQKELNYDPPPATASRVARLTFGKLILADGSDWVPTVPIKYYAILYSSSWCPASGNLPPLLKQLYTSIKPSHPEFELIFVSGDKTEGEMMSFMNSMAMPWPAVRIDDLQASGLLQYAHSRDSDFVLINSDGKLLSQAYRNDFIGPDGHTHGFYAFGGVRDDIEKILASDPSKPIDLTTLSAPPILAPTSTTVSSQNPAPAPGATETASILPALKSWSPPDVIPAQPNWTWNTLDGSTYSDVVVTKIEPDTVTITHSLGVAHIPMNLLPPDIQKKLNYDPHASADVPVTSDGK